MDDALGCVSVETSRKYYAYASPKPENEAAYLLY